MKSSRRTASANIIGAHMRPMHCHQIRWRWPFTDYLCLPFNVQVRTIIATVRNVQMHNGQLRSAGFWLTRNTKFPYRQFVKSIAFELTWNWKVSHAARHTHTHTHKNGLNEFITENCKKRKHRALLRSTEPATSHRRINYWTWICTKTGYAHTHTHTPMAHG